MRTLIRLVPPNISSDNSHKKIICIRSHRERIFRTEPEIQENSTIFHNYGHGGAGWTFLFGSVYASLNQFQILCPRKSDPIAVIGAGCYGLLTAILLARRGHKVRLIAQETENIVSPKAAGFFFPRPRKNATALEANIFTAYGLESYKAYTTICEKTHPFLTHGVRRLPCYFGEDIDPGFQPYIAQSLMDRPEPVTIDFQNGKIHNMQRYTTLFIDAQALMEQFKSEFSRLEIPLIREKIENFSQIPESLIFNCAGRGAKELTGDKLLIPVQGHLIALGKQERSEALDYMINVSIPMPDAQGRIRDKLLYYAPKEAGILGITFLRGQDSLTTNMHEFDELLKRAHLFFGPN